MSGRQEIDAHTDTDRTSLVSGHSLNIPHFLPVGLFQSAHFFVDLQSQLALEVLFVGLQVIRSLFDFLLQFADASAKTTVVSDQPIGVDDVFFQGLKVGSGVEGSLLGRLAVVKGQVDRERNERS